MHDIASILCYAVLLCMAISDIRTRHIPDSLILLLLAFGILGICARAGSLFSAFLSLLFVGIPMLILSVRMGDGIGGGDVKMCAATAFCFGAEPVLWIICITLILMVCICKLLRKQALPMAPYFALCSLFLLI